MSNDALLARCKAAVSGLYDIEAEIGRGGMAVVYRATDLRLRRKVALKVLPPELAFREEVKSRFLREAEMSARLSHPHIVPIYSVDEADGLVYFSMGLVDGESLAARLAREPQLEIPVARRVLREVALALHYAHQHGVVHRDVKPDNILIENGTGRAVVTDFGIARAAEGDQRLTVTGIAVGTPAYMSPEQAMGERQVDGRVDIYSLGVVGYQMLTGELPFQATSTPAMLMKHISDRPRPIDQIRPDVPTALIHTIERAMAKGRDERWPDAEAFAVSLDGLSADREGQSAVAALERLSKRTPLPAPPFPALPRDWMFDPATREHGGEALREWREAQRVWRAEKAGGTKAVPEKLRKAANDLKEIELKGQRSPEERIRRLRRKLVSGVGVVGFLAAINALTSPFFPWFLFPALGIFLGIANGFGGLWADGIPIRYVFMRPPRPAVPGSEQPLRRLEAKLPAPAASGVAEAVLDSIPGEVLEGPDGYVIKDAYDARSRIRSLLARLPESDKQLLPEILPTVEALVERVRTLAIALFSLDRDASPDALARLKRRIAEVEDQPAGAPERERRLELLNRQLATLGDLAERRVTLRGQMENASLVLETIKLDLTRLRSSGVEMRLADAGAMTEEVRALSQDVRRAAEALDEVRKGGR